MPSAPPIVLSIAGFDPSSGAGVTADIKTIAAHGCYGVTCITALTIQSTTGVRRVEPVRAPETGLAQSEPFAIRRTNSGADGSCGQFFGRQTCIS